MSHFDPLGKAKKAAEMATQTALGVKEQATSKAAEIRDLTVSKAEEAQERVSGARENAVAKMSGLKDLVIGKLGDVKEAAFAHVKEMTDDLNEHLPALREAGYVLHDVSVEVGVTPKVVATFGAQPDITEERIAQVIEEHKEAKVTIVLLKALFTAYKLQNSIKIAGMKPHGIALELGITPALAVKFG